jgi:membrane-bound metal-dependent hydrolase YbcI (DUF457 family)
MPNFKGHLIGGYITGIITLVLFSMWNHTFPSLGLLVTSLITIGFYCLLPDLDTRASQARLIITISCAMIALLGLTILHNTQLSIWSICALIFLWLFEFMPGGQHRGVIHTIWAAFVFAMPLYFYFGFEVGIIGLVSYISHLILDGSKH